MARPLSKAKFKEMMYNNEPRYLSAIAQIEFDLFISLELETRNNIVIDSLTNQPLSCNGKFICYPKDTIQDKTIIPFDPFNNPRLMQFLFSIYMRNIQRRGTPVLAFFLTPIDVSGYGTAVCRSNNKDISSNLFINEPLRYIDLILLMEGNPSRYSVNEELDKYFSFIKEEKILERKAK